MIRSAIFLSVALAFATTAYAQDTTSSDPAPATTNQTADAGSMPAPAKTHHVRKHHQYSKAAMALTGDDAKTAAYQASDRQKAYPAIDRAHVPGDPPIIDHSDDQAAVTPTSTKVMVPPNQ